MSKKLGLVGYGQMGRRQAKVFSEMPGMEIVACCNPTPAKLQRFQDRTGIQSGFTDYEEMMDSVPLDAVLDLCDRRHEIGLYVHRKVDLPEPFDGGSEVPAGEWIFLPFSRPRNGHGEFTAALAGEPANPPGLEDALKVQAVLEGTGRKAENPQFHDRIRYPYR